MNIVTKLFGGQRGHKPAMGRKKRSTWLLLVALPAMVAAAGLWVTQYTSTPVVVAAHELAPQTRLVDADLRVQMAPKASGMLLALAASPEVVVGKYTAVRIQAGQAIALSELVTQTDDGSQVVDGLVVPQGLVRASASFQIDHAVAGRIAPGDKVIILALPAGSTPAGSQASAQPIRVVASDILVLHADNAVSDAPPGLTLVQGAAPKAVDRGATMVITFAAAPDVAERIVGLGALGRLAVIKPIGRLASPPPDSISLN